ncbi:hypothetical protein EVAR_67910_1 [Eumeta japonica]|uniref:Uncharacterized protein n=1 Tax=Eumeta variegata TaxID=151549 RepID=A0A4C1YW85_EUMVA|nr:hypothetical protein EVAR_67910_1 [Eumeta japonica]
MLRIIDVTQAVYIFGSALLVFSFAESIHCENLNIKETFYVFGFADCLSSIIISGLPSIESPAILVFRPYLTPSTAVPLPARRSVASSAFHPPDGLGNLLDVELR